MVELMLSRLNLKKEKEFQKRIWLEKNYQKRTKTMTDDQKTIDQNTIKRTTENNVPWSQQNLQ